MSNVVPIHALVSIARMISRRRILSAKINNSSTMASWLPIVSKWNRSDMSLSNRTMFEKSSRRKILTHSRISKTFTEWTTRQISSLYCLLRRDLTDDQSNNASTFLNGMNSKKNVTRRWCTERNYFSRWNFTIPIQSMSKPREFDRRPKSIRCRWDSAATRFESEVHSCWWITTPYNGLFEFFLNSTNEELSEFNLKWGNWGYLSWCCLLIEY